MTLRARCARVVVGVLLLLGPASSARAYDYDTHYLWTYYLALHVGYSPRQAYQIASATFSIDYDPQTGPLEATAQEAFRAEARPGIENVWTRFHAFADARYSELSAVNPMSWLEGIARADARVEAFVLRGQTDGVWVMRGDPEKVRELRDKNKNDLWNTAIKEGNPGPYLHFLQDIYSHWDFDSRRGHFIASHAPDYLSFNVSRSRRMTEDTIRALEEFAAHRGIALRTRSAEIMPRVWEVFDRLVAVNPPTWPGELRYYDLVLQTVQEKGLKYQDQSVHAMIPSLSGIGSPKGPEALRIIRDAIDEDRQFSRLSGFPDVWFEHLLPQQWYQYDYDAKGETGHASANRDRFPVEWPEVVIGDASLTCAPEPDSRDLVRLTLRVPYEIRGAASLNFQHPLPLFETSVLSDSGEQKPGTLERENGRYEIVRYVLRPRADLNGSAKWTVAIAVGPGDQRAVVETPLTCGQPPRQAGPVLTACPVSPILGAPRYDSRLPTIQFGPPGTRMTPYPWYRYGAPDTGAIHDGTFCEKGFCRVTCAYGPQAPPEASTLVWAAWWADAETDAFPTACAELRLVGFGAGGAGKPAVISRYQGHNEEEASRLRTLLHDTVSPNALICPGGPPQPQAAAARITKTSWLRPASTATPSIAGTGGTPALARVARTAASGATGELLRPPTAGPVRIMFGGRTVDATFEPQADGRGMPINIYYYRTTTPPGAPAPVGEQQWNRFVRSPAAGSSSNEPVVWWHAHWEYRSNAWVIVQEENVPPPQTPR